MKEHPILFSAPMVRALLAGTKTQTRRIINPQPTPEPQYGRDGAIWRPRHGDVVGSSNDLFRKMMAWRSPFGKPGDRLWVRETIFWSNCDDGWCYQADNSPVMLEEYTAPILLKKKPAIPCIHMPREASRILLEKTTGRVEQLQDISEADAQAEGLEWYADEKDGGRDAGWQCYPKPEPGAVGLSTDDACYAYRTLWESIHGPGSWDANPWLWVEEFKRIQP